MSKGNLDDNQTKNGVEEENALDKELSELSQVRSDLKPDAEQDEDSTTEEETEETEEEEESEEDDSSDDTETEESTEEKKEAGDSEESDDEESEEDDSEEEESEESTQTTKKRPKKYIPIPQFQEEKRKRQEAEEERDRLKQQLEGISETEEGSKAEEDAVKAFAEEHGLDEKQVKGLLDLARAQVGIPKARLDAISKIEEQQKQDEQRRQEKAAQEAFESEFKDTVIPALKEKYPNATDDEIADAKELMDELAHSPKFHKYDLDYILFKKGKEIGKLFSTTKTKTAEKTGMGKNTDKTKELDAKYFEDKNDFTELQELDATQREKILADMSPETYVKYGNWFKQNEKSFEVNRGGKRVKV